MPESFGARLRQRREERQIALTSIADETKIKLSLLEGLERDDVSHWPSGIFRKAYLRTYAHMIGLDPDEALREFLELYPEPADMFEEHAVALATAGDPSRRAGPPTRLRNMVDSAIGSLARLRRPGSVDDPGPRHGTRLGVRPQAGPRPAEAPLRAASETPIEGDDLEHMRPPAGPEPSDQPVQVLAATAISVPALLKPADIDAPPVTPPAEQLAFNPPVRVSSPTPQSETLVVEPVEQAVVAPAESPAAPAVQDPPAPKHDLDALAGLCSALARVQDRTEVQQLLQEAARE